MAVEQKKQKINFIRCPNCQGQGFIENKKCPQCQGMGVVLPFFGRFLYWGKKIDRQNIFIDKAIQISDKVINLLVIAASLFGFFVLFYFAYKNQFQEITTAKYWLTSSWEKAIFWFSLILILYLYYRLRKENSYKYRVLPKIFFKEELPSQIDWSYIVAQPKKNFIDISAAFDSEALGLVEQAWLLAREFSHAKVQRIHFFSVMTRFNQGALIFGRLGINMKKFKEKISRVLNWNIDKESRKTDFSPEVYKILLAAYHTAYHENKNKVEISEILLNLINLDIFEKYEIVDDYIEKILIDLDLNYQQIENVIAWIRIQDKLRENLMRLKSQARYRSKSGLDKAMTAVATPFLNKFSTDLTKQAKFGQLFPCIGREKEFDEIYRIIEGSKDSILLVGNQGVGRTSIINGLAQKMIEEAVPEKLQDKRLVSISLSRLLSGASAAEAEERLLIMANEVIKSKNIILVIEDLHKIYSVSTDLGGGLDVADVLSELLNKGLFYVIATTTPVQYSKIIEGSSLDANFRAIKVAELEINNAIQVLEAKSGPLEYKNNVFFSYISIEKAAQLTSRYIHDRYLPEKALDIMEEVAVKVRKEKGERAIISGEDVATILSDKIGVKTTKITEKESEKLLNLEDEIHKRVIGQDEAVKMVAASLRRARAELREAKRPISNLLFLGPTGVGKTELAKTVAEVYFGNEKNMIRFDMSEFQDQASISRLIGSGSQSGQLTEAVRNNPFSLLLFDEVEKAHRDILNLFLQVMDDGRLTDGQGRTVDFTNVIIIMTSNAGAQSIQEEIRKNIPVEQIKELLLDQELKQYFRPEFLNRFDGIIVFKPLTMTEVIQIARLLSQKVVDRLAQKNITLQITDAAISELAELGYDPKFGARPLRRVIQEKVDDTLANYLLKGEIGKRDLVVLEPGGELKIEKAEQI